MTSDRSENTESSDGDLSVGDAEPGVGTAVELEPDGDASVAGEVGTDSAALQSLYQILAQTDTSFESKVNAVLELGCNYLDVEIGFLTRIRDGTQLIIASRAMQPEIKPGASCPLSEAYCERTVESESIVATGGADASSVISDAAYDRFGIETYIGAKVVVDGDVYGTFCFGDSEPRADGFTDEEKAFVEITAQCVGYEIFNLQAKAELRQQRDQLDEFASVLSHDLRNPLSVLDGYLELARREGDAEHFDACEDAVDRMQEMIDELLESARDGDVTGDLDPLSLRDAAYEAWATAETGECDLTVAGDVILQGDSGRVRQLLENVFRNAHEHNPTGWT